jgi:uncharacterized protein with NRDE domain
MCLIVLRWQPGSLIVAANRDEFHHRPTAPLAFWPDAPGVLAGRDLQSGGTWLGTTRDGRFAALTNYRDPSRQRDDARSRGHLVSGFLAGDEDVHRYAARVQREGRTCNGFNLLLYDGASLLWVGHQPASEVSVGELSPGVHALSNHLPGTPWPKLLRARTGFTGALEQQSAQPALFDRLFRVLSDETPADDADLPDTGVGLEWERRLSPVFIRGDAYGTCSSAVLELTAQRIDFEERRYRSGGLYAGSTHIDFER